jgi:hypothetical protein
VSRDAVLILFAIAVPVCGGIVALIWWSLADRFFPGAARSTGQGLRKGQKPRSVQPPQVVTGFDQQPDKGDVNTP